MKKKSGIAAILILSVLFLVAGGVSAAKENPTHLDKSKIRHSCRACHDASGRGKRGMLKDTPVGLCLRCHGPSGKAEERAMSNIFSLIIKRSNHPVMDTSKYHIYGEVLPEKDPSMPRHVSCLDCHSVHATRPGKVLEGRKGIDIAGNKKRTAEKESEVCYNCHSDSANLPYESSNIRFQFDPSNASYHPVERVSKGRSVSLFRDIRQGSFITCTSCHEPHGSDYPPLLRTNYNMTDGAESSYAYELCYTCHNRDSILSNQSFKGSTMLIKKPKKGTTNYGHQEHIVYANTSCFTCHASHGSNVNPNLIEFNPSVVTGSRQYFDSQGGRAQCNLTCHGIEH